MNQQLHALNYYFDLNNPREKERRENCASNTQHTDNNNQLGASWFSGTILVFVHTRWKERMCDGYTWLIEETSYFAKKTTEFFCSLYKNLFKDSLFVSVSLSSVVDEVSAGLRIDQASSSHLFLFVFSLSLVSSPQQFFSFPSLVLSFCFRSPDSWHVFLALFCLNSFIFYLQFFFFVFSQS